MEKQLKLSIQARYENVVTSIRSTKMLRDLRYMGMIGIFTNISQRNTQRMKSSLTYLRLSLLLWILKLRLSKVSLMLNHAQKKFWQSQYRTIQLSRSLLGEVNLLLTNKRM